MNFRRSACQLPLAACAILTLAMSAPERAQASPEKEVLRISKLLKPLADEEWQKIAGERAAEKYEITQGDTLWDISRRLFGDPRYWPKVWALNNPSITNPHLIRPGNRIAFLPGSGVSLPAVAIQEAGGQSALPANDPSPADQAGMSSGRSREWKKLPRQSWENVELALPPEVDPLGFDRRSKIYLKTSAGMEMPMIATSEKLKGIGEIIGSRVEAKFFTIGHTVFIKGEEGALQLNEIYALTKEPYTLTEGEGARTGYSYSILGKVKIIGYREGLYTGRILTTRHWVDRGTVLIPMPPRVRDMEPVGGSELGATMLIDKTNSTSDAAQHKIVFIDKGSEDGVQAGNIFRAFQHVDPSNGKPFTDSDFIDNADIMILQVSEKFSAGLMIGSKNTIRNGSPVERLEDVSELLKRRKRTENRKARGEGPDELDALDKDGEMTDAEKRELKQVEQWKKNPEPAPAMTDPAAAPAMTEPAPAESAPPMDPAADPAVDPNAAPVDPAADPNAALVDPAADPNAVPADPAADPAAAAPPESVPETAPLGDVPPPPPPPENIGGEAPPVDGESIAPPPPPPPAVGDTMPATEPQ